MLLRSRQVERIGLGATTGGYLVWKIARRDLAVAIYKATGTGY